MKTAGTVDNPVIGDIWDKHAAGDFIVIPVNLQGIHGRGLAKQAFDKGLIKYHQNTRYIRSPFDQKIITVAVKGEAPTTAKYAGKAWSEKVTGGNLELLRSELLNVAVLGVANPDITIWCPFLGLGFGEGDPSEIFPILQTLNSVLNIFFIKPGADVFAKYKTSFVPGARRDKLVAA